MSADLVHVPSDAIAAADPDWGASLLGDLSHSLVFDNSKLRAVVPDYRPSIPFEQGAREMVAWHDEEPSRQRIKHVSGYQPRAQPLGEVAQAGQVLAADSRSCLHLDGDQPAVRGF